MSKPYIFRRRKGQLRNPIYGPTKWHCVSMTFTNITLFITTQFINGFIYDSHCYWRLPPFPLFTRIYPMDIPLFFYWITRARETVLKINLLCSSLTICAVSPRKSQFLRLAGLPIVGAKNSTKPDDRFI